MLHPCPHPPCPDCGADDALALRATYHYHPPLPLRWLARVFPRHLTLVYTCAACHQRVPRQHHPSPRSPPRSSPASAPPPARKHRSTRALAIRRSPDARLMAAPRGRLPPATSGRSRPLVYGATDRDRGGDVVSRVAPARKSGRGQPSPPRSTPVRSYYSNDDPAARTVRDKLPALPVRAKLWRTPRLAHLIDSPSYVLLCFLQR